LATAEDEKDINYSTLLTGKWVKYISQTFRNTFIQSFYEYAPKSILPSKLKKQGEMKLEDIDISDISILDFSVRELARQITLIDQDIIYKIPNLELMNKKFENENGSPNVQLARDTFSTLTRWVATEILQAELLKERQRIICHFILLCEKLKDLQNYNGLMAIYTGLYQFPIQRLKSTWKSINFIYLRKWRAIEELMSPMRNFRELRELQAKASPPKIPCLTILFHDLVLSEDGNEDFWDKEKKNF